MNHKSAGMSYGEILFNAIMQFNVVFGFRKKRTTKKKVSPDEMSHCSYRFVCGHFFQYSLEFSRTDIFTNLYKFVKSEFIKTCAVCFDSSKRVF